MSVRFFTAEWLPSLLDFLEARNSWGDASRGLGRLTFQQTLAQPGLEPESNCLLLETEAKVQGYCLITPEVKIGRAVLEPNVAPQLVGTSSEHELMLRALERCQTLDVSKVHVCVTHPSPTADFLLANGFAPVRSYLNMVWSEEAAPSAALPEGFTVRPFKTGDAVLLTDAQNSAFASSWGFSPNTVEQIEYRSSMANTSHHGIIFLNHAEETAGYCWTCMVPVEGSIRGMISMIGIVPEYRGRGISRHILAAGMEYLCAQEVADIGLQVDASNTPGVRLYASVGFQTVEELHWFERVLR